MTELILFELLSLPLLFLFIGLVFFFITWSVDRKMTIDHSEKWGYGNFKKFKECFDILEWERDENHPKSYFGKGEEYYQNKIHAGIIMFEKKGMVLLPWSYVKFIFWQRENSLNNKTKGKKIKW